MQRTLNCVPLIVPDAETNPAFSVVIAYEDFETGKLAKRTYDLLVENVGHDCTFVNQMWKFDVLSIPKLREIAIEDAARANIILVSCRGTDLPRHVKAWIEAWLNQARHPRALVALFSRPREGMSQISATRDFLADMARRAGMEFFAQSDDQREAKHDQVQPGVSDRPGSNRTALSSLAGAVRREGPLQRWSLDD